MAAIRHATLGDLDLLVPLFDAYRQFYRTQSDPEAARQFLRDRIALNESVIFLAIQNANAIGFAQLYPLFSSAAMARTFILNDLFVTPEYRHTGIGSALLKAAADHARATGAIRLTLSTELGNATAQALYEKSGWLRDNVFCVYHLAL